MATGSVEATILYLHLAINSLEECGFSRTYGSYYVREFALLKREGHVLQNHLGVNMYIYVSVINYRHIPSSVLIRNAT